MVHQSKSTWRRVVLVALTSCIAALTLFAGLALLLNSGLQLAALVVLGEAPLWLYLAVSFVVLGVVVPLGATPPILLYGDAVARHRDEESETRTEPADAAVG